MNTTTDSNCQRCQRQLPHDSPEALCPYCLMALVDDEITNEWSARPSGDFVPPTIEELQQHFQPTQLEIISLHGRGGMGAVYRAHQPKLSRDVALKILPPELAMAPGFDERFQREAQVLAKLDHSGIVDVYDFGKAGPYSYLLLEFVDGVNLRELIVGGEASPSDALEIVPQLCDALQFAHDAGVVHRDVKPENILIDTRGRVKITDFGLAKLARVGSSQNLTRTRQAMGTPQYMAPEQIEHPKNVDHRADIYAMGVVFYELLTGELPLGRFDPPSRKSKTSRRLDRVVLKTLEKDPDKRFGQASEVKTEVEKEPKSEIESKSRPQKWVDAAVERATQAKEKAVEFTDSNDSYSDIIVGGLATGTYLALISGLFTLQDGPVGLILIAIAVFGWWATLRLLRRDTIGKGVETYCKPLSIASGLASSLPQLVRSSTDENASGFADRPNREQARRLVLIQMGLAIFFWYFMSMSIAVAVFIVGAVIARFTIEKLPVEQRSRADKWCLYPPILCIVIPVLAILAFWPTLATTITLLEMYDGNVRLLEGTPEQVSRLFPLVASAGCAIQFGWLTLLTYFAGRFPVATRFVCKPLIETWNGGGSYVATVLAFMAAVVFVSLTLKSFAG